MAYFYESLTLPPGMDAMEEKRARYREKRQEQRLDAIAENILLEISQNTENNPELKEFFTEAEKAILRYAETVGTLAEVRLADLSLVESSDQARRIAHNSLVDSLNILSRQCRKEEVSNEWRRKIGEGHDEIGDWALRAAVFIRTETLKTEYPIDTIGRKI